MSEARTVFDPYDLPMSSYHLLCDLAGMVDIDLIADELGLTPAEVEQAAHAFDLDLTVEAGTGYCPQCGEARVMRRAADGTIECPVCAMRGLTERAEARERAAFDELPPDEQEAIIAGMRSRGARKSRASTMARPTDVDPQELQDYDLAQELTRYRRTIRRAQRYEERLRVLYGGDCGRVPLAAIPDGWDEQRWLSELAKRGKMDKLRETGPWRELRDKILSERPMCDCCGTLPSVTVRHVRSPKVYRETALSETFTATDGTERRNLVALCSKCAADRAERWKVGACDRLTDPPTWILDGRAASELES